MALGEDCLELLMHVGNFTKEVMGISTSTNILGAKKTVAGRARAAYSRSAAKWKTGFLRI